MKVSRHWLSKFFDQELPSADILADALTFHAFEIESIESSEGDEVLDVKITANRGHDCLSHRGIARELAASLSLPFVHDPLALIPDLSKKTDAVSVVVDDPQLCQRYIAGYIKGVTVGPSPKWLKKNLEAIGQRSINNIVDATNFVMYNLGQPLHAFDAKKLSQKEGSFLIRVRKARPGEKIRALDEKEYTLTDSMLLITDGNAEVAIGIAGVKGGAPASIGEDTTDIIIESAHFSGPSVRKTAQALKLRTDASSRFEQHISPELAGFGMQSIVELIQKIAGGEVVGFTDVYQKPQQETRVSVSVAEVNALLGTNLTAADVANAFSSLQFGYKEADGVFEVVSPRERLDLIIPEDLIEEVARIIGYDKIPTKELLLATAQPHVNKNFYLSEHVRENLMAQGYSEVYTSVFRDTGEREVFNKVGGDKPYLRSNLLDGLSEALKKNIPNKDLLALPEVRLFEIGTVWRTGEEKIMVGTITEKEKAKELPLENFLTIAIPAAYESLPLSSATRFEPFSKYPYIVRDIALWAGGTDAEEVLQIIKNEAGALLMRVFLFDRFEKAGRVSLAFRLIFQSFERTLEEKEAHESMEKVSSSLRERGFEIR